MNYRITYLLILLFLLVFSYSLFAQIDTLESLSYFPMHIGDTWEYQCRQTPAGGEQDTTYNWYNITRTIVGDTVMPNSMRYFVFNDDRYLRIDTTALCVYEYIYDEEVEMLYLYCCADTEIVFGDVGVGFFSISHIDTNILAIDHMTLISESYTLLQHWGIYYYMFAENGPPFQMYMIRAKVDDRVYDYKNSISNEITNFDKFQLGKNYPNPFNNTTTIPYEIRHSGNVKISIYDICGHLMEVILDQHHEVGLYSVKWNASNYSSGIYIFNIEMGNIKKWNKCIYLK